MFLIFVRILSIAFAFPFVRNSVPKPFVVLFCLVVAIISATAKAVSGSYIDSLGLLFLGCLQEVLIGALIGLLVNLALEAVQMAGRIVGFQMAFAMGAVVEPISGEQDTSLSQLYNLFGAMLFFGLDCHLVILKAIIESLHTLPPFFSPMMPERISQIFPIFGAIFVVAIKISAPVLATLILTSLSFGMAAKLTPQLNIFFVLLPFKILVGLMALVFSISFTCFGVKDFYNNFLKLIISFLTGG
ncbi:MAG: flagellar biosynthetic protein FliR [Desulfatiglandales bacterium]